MKLQLHRLFAFVSLLAVAMPALAAAEAAHDDGGGNIFAGDAGNIIWTLAVFLLVVFVLGKFAWGPILAGLKAREDFIHDSLAKAKADRDEAAAQLKLYEQKLADARAAASALVEEGRRDADALRQAYEAKAKEEAEQTLQRAKREISIAKETAIKELYTLSGKLATDIAGKIVQRELKPEDHEKLIRETLAQLSGRAN